MLIATAGFQKKDHVFGPILTPGRPVPLSEAMLGLRSQLVPVVRSAEAQAEDTRSRTHAHGRECSAQEVPCV